MQQQASPDSSSWLAAPEGCYWHPVPKHPAPIHQLHEHSYVRPTRAARMQTTGPDRQAHLYAGQLPSVGPDRSGAARGSMKRARAFRSHPSLSCIMCTVSCGAFAGQQADCEEHAQGTCRKTRALAPCGNARTAAKPAMPTKVTGFQLPFSAWTCSSCSPFYELQP